RRQSFIAANTVDPLSRRFITHRAIWIAKLTPALHLRLTRSEELARGADFRLDRVGAREGPVRLAIPVPGVVEIALQGVHDAVQPGRFRGLVRLDDGVSVLPRAPLQKLDNLHEPF